MSKNVQSITSCIESTSDNSFGGTRISDKSLKCPIVQELEEEPTSSNSTFSRRSVDCTEEVKSEYASSESEEVIHFEDDVKNSSVMVYPLQRKISSCSKLEGSCSSNSTSTVKTMDNHYIKCIQPDCVSCSLTPLGSDEVVEPYENEVYASVLTRELNISNDSSRLNEEETKKRKEFVDDSNFEVIPLTDIFEENVGDLEEVKVDLIPEVTVRTKTSGPRLTTSDSIISMTRKYFHGIGNDKAPPTQVDATVWHQQQSFRKLCTELLQKPNTDSDQTMSSTPVSIFENDKFKSFTDSNSNEDDHMESIKPLSGRKKSTTGRVEFKKGIELKKSSLVSVSSTVCRICHTNTVNERLLSPCYCKGSLAYVHLSCLERWLNQSSRSYCELCLYQYNAVESLRYGFLEGIRLWIRHPRNRNHVRSDCLIAFLLTLVTFGLLVICFIGMDYFMIEGVKLGMSKMWTKSFIVSFLGVITMGYIVTIYLIVKDQFVPWYTWWKNTLNIRLLLSPAVTQNQRI